MLREIQGGRGAVNPTSGGCDLWERPNSRSTESARAVHSGAPIAAAHQCGCDIAVGVDGLALDEDDDVIREMRLVQLAHGGLGFKRTWTRPEFFGLALGHGRRAARGAGALGPGSAADFVVIDLDRLDRDRIMPVDPLQLLFARGNASLVRDVVVAGRTIVPRAQPTAVVLPAT